MPGAESFIQRHTEYTIAIVTNTRLHIIQRELRELGYLDTFKYIYTADKYIPKPDPCMLLSALQDTHISVEHSIMIGDTRYDKEAADAASMRFIPVNAFHWNTDSVSLDDISL